MSIYRKLSLIQSTMKAPKNQMNSFGGYKFRNVEGILESLKPFLEEHELMIFLNDEIVNVEGRFYVKATATLCDMEGKEVSTVAYAREEEHKKGMDGSQVTGASSSYARKYALNGLLAIDNSELDPDNTNKHGKNLLDAQQRATLKQTATGKDVEAVKIILGDLGYKSSAEIEKDDFDEIIERIKCLETTKEN